MAALVWFNMTVYPNWNVSMSSANYKNKNVGEIGWQYTDSILVSVTNKRRRNFKKEYNHAVARSTTEDAAYI